MSISAAVPVSQDVVVYYHSTVGMVGDRPPVVANLLKPGNADGFIPTMPGKSITQLWSSAYSGSFRTPFSESLEVHHNHSTGEECLHLASVALQSGEVWRISELLSRLRGCRDTMSLFRDSATLTYPLKLVTPSPSGGLPQITDKGTVNLGGVLECEISLDKDTISRIELLFSRFVLRLDPRDSVVIDRPRKPLKASSKEFLMPGLPPVAEERLPDPHARRSTEEPPHTELLPDEDFLARDDATQRQPRAGVSLIGLLRDCMGIAPDVAQGGAAITGGSLMHIFRHSTGISDPLLACEAREPARAPEEEVGAKEAELGPGERMGITRNASFESPRKLSEFLIQEGRDGRNRRSSW